MKKFLLIFLITIFLMFSLALGISIAAQPFARVDSLKGEVTVIRTNEDLEAATGMGLLKDDTLKTGDESSVTIIFDEGFKSTIADNEESVLNDIYLRAKIDALKRNIKKPGVDIIPAKMSIDTIGGTRGTEEGEKKSKDLKNEHHWEEKVE